MIYKVTKIAINFIIFIVFLFNLNFCFSENTNSFLNKDIIKNHAFALANDSMLGRAIGQLGINKAKSYIENQLNIISNSNTSVFLQKIPIIEISTLPETDFIINNSFGSKSYSLYQDYLVHSSGLMSYYANQIPLIFAGFGIFAPEYDYNNYNNLNVSGKAVVILDGAPNDIFAKEHISKYSSIEFKQRTAIARGATAVIVINHQVNSNILWNYRLNQYKNPEYNLAFGGSSILTIILNPNHIIDLFPNEFNSTDIDFLLKNGNKLIENSSIIFKAKYRDRSFPSDNIIFKINGSDPILKDECMIVTAHYDHLGVDDNLTDSVYNGFLDNALGCSVLLEFARFFSKAENLPKRTLLLIFTTGEEFGLIGSKYYINNPLIPLYKTIANLNIDGIAYIDNFKSVIGIGSELSNLREILNLTADELNLKVNSLDTNSFDLNAFEKSDQIIFAYGGIPSILIYDGFEYENIKREIGFNKFVDYFENYYHTPYDDTKIDVNWNAVLQHSNFLIYFIQNITNTNFKSEWNQNNRFYLERLRTIIEKR